VQGTGKGIWEEVKRGLTQEEAADASATFSFVQLLTSLCERSFPTRMAYADPGKSLQKGVHLPI
jgi:hypothetical protein